MLQKKRRKCPKETQDLLRAGQARWCWSEGLFHLLPCIWGSWGGLGRIQQLSLFIPPFLMLLSFSDWSSLCSVVGISVSKHKQLECVLLLVILSFMVMLHYYSNSENACCLYSWNVCSLCLLTFVCAFTKILSIFRHLHSPPCPSGVAITGFSWGQLRSEAPLSPTLGRLRESHSLLACS